MKIRLKGNSVRFRLTKTEVETFCKTGYFAEHTEFNTNVFTYALKSKEGLEGLEADYKENTITVYLSAKEQDNWALTERVGFQNTVRLKNGQELFLLVEKDFVCMDETIEDQSDNYPNPNFQK